MDKWLDVFIKIGICRAAGKTKKNGLVLPIRFYTSREFRFIHLSCNHCILFVLAKEKIISAPQMQLNAYMCVFVNAS